MTNQFGVKLRDAVPIWIIGPWENQQALVNYLHANAPAAIVHRATYRDDLTINPEAIEAICGPNDPKPFDIYKG